MRRWLRETSEQITKRLGIKQASGVLLHELMYSSHLAIFQFCGKSSSDVIKNLIALQ